MIRLGLVLAALALATACGQYGSPQRVGAPPVAAASDEAAASSEVECEDEEATP